MNASFLYIEAAFNNSGEPVFSVFDGRTHLNLLLKTTDPKHLAQCLIKEQDSPGSLRSFLNLAPKPILDIFNLD